MTSHPVIVKDLDNPQHGDTYLAGLVAVSAIYTGLGWNPVWGILMAALVAVPGVAVSIFFTAMFTDPKHPRARTGRLVSASVLAVLVGLLGNKLGIWAVAIGTTLFAFLAVRTIQRDHKFAKTYPDGLPPLPAKPAKTALASPEKPSTLHESPDEDEVTPIPPRRDPADKLQQEEVAEALSNLPPDLPASIQTMIDTAILDYQHLRELLADDPLLPDSVGLDPANMLAEAEQVLLALLTQAPRVARVQRIAERRPDDPAAAQAAATATSALQHRADTLHNATSAALALIATPNTDDTAALRDHTANLQLLHQSATENTLN